MKLYEYLVKRINLLDQCPGEFKCGKFFTWWRKPTPDNKLGKDYNKLRLVCSCTCRNMEEAIEGFDSDCWMYDKVTFHSVFQDFKRHKHNPSNYMFIFFTTVDFSKIDNIEILELTDEEAFKDYNDNHTGINKYFREFASTSDLYTSVTNRLD